MSNPQSIKEITTKLISGKCKNCGYRPRYRDKKWCPRCIAVWKCQQYITKEWAENKICKLVGPLYLDAKLDDLSDNLHEKLLDREHGQDVFFYGPIGTGKTYAMAALIRHCVYLGYDCARINFDDFCVQVRSSMSPASKLTEWDMIEPMKNVDMLFIDDLGLRSKQETDFAYVTLYSLLNKRQERMLPTFISSNKNIKRLAEAFDSRIASRLSTALIIEMGGVDRRAKAVKENQK